MFQHHNLKLTRAVQTDILYFAQTQPEILIPGCNQGKVNSFNAIDINTLTSGAYTAKSAAANPVCFATTFAKAELPLLTGVSNLGPVSSALDNVIKSLNCPAISKVNQSALTVCPGFSFYGGPTGPVAPGAIQS